jgi:LPXTG-motif cell wall-anchored protein
LKSADSYVVTWTIAIVIIVIAILAVWYRRKKKE